jgi:hypothetical protein
MKNFKIIYLFIALLAFTFWGCEKEYENLYRVTFFPDITITGESLTFAPKGTTYQDAGAVSTENGVEIETKVVSNVNSSATGSYAVTYSAMNVDSFPASKVRKVLIYDPNTNATDISGTYTGNVARGPRVYNGNPVTLTKVEGQDGIYFISDWIAGFYDVGAAYKYGSAYRFLGYIQITANNDVVYLDQSNPWNNPFLGFVGTYDPATMKLHYEIQWATYTFVVDLTKN